MDALFSDTLRSVVQRRTANQGLRQLSRETGIDPAVLSKFQSGQTGLSLATIDALCRVLGLRLVEVKREQRK